MDVFAESLSIDPRELLNSRELRIATYFAQGSSRAVIARLLDISPSRVTQYRERIMCKLRIGSNAELAVLMWRAGLTQRRAS